MYKLLVVDDEKLIREGMARAIAALNIFEIYMADSGVEALKILESTPIDAMLLDISMPDMNGLQLLRSLSAKNINPFTIIISGYEQFEYAREAMCFGAVDYALKPVDSDDLADMCKRLLEKIQQRQMQSNQLEQLQQHVLSHLDDIRQKLLTDILDGEIVSIEDMKTLYGIDLHGDHFCAAVLLLRRSSPEVGEVNFQVALKSFEESLAQLLHKPYPFNVNLFNMENARYILLISGTDALSGDAIDALLDEALAYAGQIPNIKAYAGKGGQVLALDSLSASYAQANEALDYRSIFGHGVVYDIRDYQTNSYLAAANQYLDDIEESLRLKLFDEVEIQINKLFDHLLAYIHDLTHGQFRFFVTRCQICLTSILIRNNIDLPEEILVDRSKAHGSMPTERTIQRYRERTLQLLRIIRSSLNEGYKSQHKQLAAQVRRHVDENYHNNQLSVNGLSARFGYTANYLGNIFKKVYALSINDYINQCRIDKAKRLMEDTPLRVYEIAFQVGFSDQHYFSKTFKKYMGVSPTEYRDR